MNGQVLFSKASVERKQQFRQLTKIIDVGGQKKVIKEPAGPESGGHILSYLDNYRKLEKALKPDARVSVIPCEINERGEAEFPFCTAETLADTMLNIPAEEYIQCILDYRRALTEAFGYEKFEVSDGFQAVFGSPEIQPGEEALSVTNLDMNFDNVFLVSGGQYMLIDYEWVFGFPVPLDYIIFRSLISNAAYGGYSPEDQKRILAGISITAEKEAAFWEMEEAFQQYVSRKEDKLDCFMETIGKSSTQLDEMISSEKNVPLLEMQLTEYKTAYDRQQAAIETLNGQLDEYKKAYDRQQAAVETLSGQRDEYKKACDSRQTAIETLNGQLDEYRKAYDRQQAAIETLNGQRDEYKKACDSRQAAIETLNGQLDEYRKAYDRQQAEIETLNGQRDEYKKACDSRQAAIETLNGQLDEYRKACDRQQAEIETLGRQAEEYSTAYRKERDERSSLLEQYSRLKTDFRKTAEEYDAFRRELGPRIWMKIRHRGQQNAAKKPKGETQ